MSHARWPILIDCVHLNETPTTPLENRRHAERTYRSGDNGEHWSTQQNEVSTLSIKNLAVDSSSNGEATLFATTYMDIYRSTDRGDHWIKIPSNNARGYGTNMLVIGHDKENALSMYTTPWTPISEVRVSLDTGKTWTMLPAFGNSGYWNPFDHMYFPSCFAIRDSVLFVATWWEGVFFITPGRDQWTRIRIYWNTPGGYRTINGMNFCGSDLYGAGNSELDGGKCLFRCPLDQIILSVHQNETDPDRPTGFELFQNHPNPFNPSTTIPFTLSSKSHVSLKIFDVRGRDVATLVNENLPPGTYQRQWNASGMPSGVYFYRLKANAYMDTRRLLLLR